MTTERSSGAEGAPPRPSEPSSRRPPSARSSASSSTSSTEAGRVGRAHGLDGSFYVTRPLPGLLEHGRELTVGGTERAVERRSGTDAKPILRLSGIGSREAVEAVRGEPLLVPNDELPPLAEGEYWPHQLEGCTVVDADREVGVVARMVALPSCEALEVGDRLIPLVADAVRHVDVEARRIDVDLRFLGEEPGDVEGHPPGGGPSRGE